jgi:hypothetical protein
VAPAGLNILLILVAIGLAIVAGVALGVVEQRRSARTTPRAVPESPEVLEHRRKAA